MTVTGAIHVDLRESFVGQSARRQAINGVRQAPAGARVIILIDPHQMYLFDEDQLREDCQHLHLEVWCPDAVTVRRWIDGLRNGVNLGVLL